MSILAQGFFFSADTLAELARKIVMKYQRVPMPPDNLQRTVARYNSFVDSGVDEDFGKPKPLYKIATPPFYAAWATPVIHDTAHGPAHQRALPGDGHERRTSSRACIAAANRPAGSASTASPAPPARATSPVITRCRERNQRMGRTFGA